MVKTRNNKKNSAQLLYFVTRQRLFYAEEIKYQISLFFTTDS